MDLDDDGSGKYCIFPLTKINLLIIFKLNFVGAIDVEELEEPLLALGLVNSREEVVALMSKVDEDN